MYDNTGDSRIVDEWTFGQYQSVATATSALQAHWASWITEADFVAIAAAGLNHVRIPIGYWAFDVSAGEPYIKSTQYSYLKQAVQWAANHGIYVIVGMLSVATSAYVLYSFGQFLLDLHGVPGSQNGFDNSGHRGSINWNTQQSNIDRSSAIIKTLAAEFSQAKYNNVVSAIGEYLAYFCPHSELTLICVYHSSDERARWLLKQLAPRRNSAVLVRLVR